MGGENKESPRDRWSPSLPARSQWHSGQPERSSVGGRLCRVNRRMVGKGQKTRRRVFSDPDLPCHLSSPRNLLPGGRYTACIGKGGADSPLKASKECLPAPSMVAVGGLLDLDVKTATLSAERVDKYSTQTREVLEPHRYDATEFHRWTSRLVSAAQYEPAGWA